jgi:hypothetical protein
VKASDAAKEVKLLLATLPDVSGKFSTPHDHGIHGPEGLLLLAIFEK